MNIVRELLLIARSINRNNLKEYQDEAISKVTKTAKKYGYKVYKIEKAATTESVYVSLKKKGRLPVRVRVSEHGGAPFRVDEISLSTGIDEIQQKLSKRLKAKEVEIIKERKEKVGRNHFISFARSNGVKTKEANEHWKLKDKSELYRAWEDIVGKAHKIIKEDKYIKII